MASWWPPRGPRALYSRLLSTAWDEPEGSGNRHHGGGGQQREQGQPHQRQACAPGPGASADALPVMLVHESPLQDAQAARARFRPGTPPSVPGRKGTRCRARFAPILRPIYAWLTFIVRLSQRSDMKARPASHPASMELESRSMERRGPLSRPRARGRYRQPEVRWLVPLGTRGRPRGQARGQPDPGSHGALTLRPAVLSIPALCNTSHISGMVHNLPALVGASVDKRR